MHFQTLNKNRFKEVVMLYTFVGYVPTVKNFVVVFRLVQNDNIHISVKNSVTVKTLEKLYSYK